MYQKASCLYKKIKKYVIKICGIRGLINTLLVPICQGSSPKGVYQSMVRVSSGHKQCICFFAKHEQVYWFGSARNISGPSLQPLVKSQIASGPEIRGVQNSRATPGSTLPFSISPQQACCHNLAPNISGPCLQPCDETHRPRNPVNFSRSSFQPLDESQMASESQIPEYLGAGFLRLVGLSKL